MDERIKDYFNQEIDIPKPFINETKIVFELERRKKKKMIIGLSIASALWTILFIISAILIAKEDFVISIFILIFAGIQIVAAGLLSYVVLKKRKVERENG